MEGTGSFGAGLLRFLADYGPTVIEVDRPDRSARRRNGKSDPLDAESAARAVQSGRASGIPKSRDAQVEMIRVLRVARRGAMKARIQAGAQIDAIIVSAPGPVRAPPRKLNPRQRIRACAALRPGPLTDPASATRPVLRSRPVAGRPCGPGSTIWTGSSSRWSPQSRPSWLPCPASE
jgi:transposase